MTEETKRLFFGFEVMAPWPAEFPKGRILDESCRHMTIAFLGQTPHERLTDQLTNLPAPPFKVGQVGHFDRCLFLPENHPRVTAWHMKWLNPESEIEGYYKQLVGWLKSNHFNVDERDRLLPHLTISRAPFSIKEWKEHFVKLPFMTKDLLLLESLGNLQYRPCWRLPIQAPFEELEHTADIAFRIRGESIHDLHRNALMALTFKFPSLIAYFASLRQVNDLDDLIIQLNEVVGQADMDKGCPFKAVSYHGSVAQAEDQTLTWDMIVDV